MQGKTEFHNFSSSSIFACFLVKKNKTKKNIQSLSSLEKSWHSFLRPESLLLQAAICRSSQPLSGFSARCLEDEQMLEAILRSNPRSDFMYVVDTRPKVRPFFFCSKKCENTTFAAWLCVFRWALFSWLGFASWMCSQQKPAKHPEYVLVNLVQYHPTDICAQQFQQSFKSMLWNVSHSWTRSRTELQEKATKMKTITPILSSSSSASRTSTSWETASKKCSKVVKTSLGNVQNFSSLIKIIPICNPCLM